MRTPSLQSARRFVDLHRRGLAALSAVVCLFAVLNVLAPPSPDSVEVVVAVREVPAGSRIRAEDISQIRVVNKNLPKDVLTDSSAVVGRVTILPLVEQTPLSGSLFLSSAPPPGLRQVPVRVSDRGLTMLVSPGSRVSVFGLAEDGTPAQIASSARVVTVLAGESSTGFGANESSGAILVLEVSQNQAISVANASLQRSLSLILE